MQTKFRQYELKTELAQKHSHFTYLASLADEPERQVILTIFASLLFHFPYECKDLLLKAESIRQLTHPHLLPILDIGIEQERLFIVHEYMPNGSLRSYLKRLSPKRLRLGEALNKVAKVGQALAYAHEHGIIHGNIKPENILLDADGQAILTDFNLTNSNSIIIRDSIAEDHAFCYMAPESFSGICDAKSDQYALGCLAYELITGHVPFAARSFPLMKVQHSYALPQRLSRWVAHLPPSLEAVILKTLAKDPARRYSDVSQFLKAIRSAMSQLPVAPLAPSANSHKKRTISYLARLPEPEDISSTTMSHAVHPLSVSWHSATEQEKTGLLHTNPFVAEETHSLAVGSLDRQSEDTTTEMDWAEEIGNLPVDPFDGQSEDITAEIALLAQDTDGCEPQIAGALPKRGRVRNFAWLSLLIFVIATSIIYACFSFVIAKPDMNLRTDTNITHAGHTKITNTPKVQASVLVAKSPTVQYPSLIAKPPTIPFSFQTPIPPLPVILTPTPTVSQSSKPHGELLNRLSWTASASLPNDLPSNALDSNAGLWSSGQPQASGQWFLVDMGSPHSFTTITLDTGTIHNGDYPRGYQVFVSNDGSNWGNVVASGNGDGQIVTIFFATQSARFIKVMQTSSASNWWTIDDFNVYDASGALNRSGWIASASLSNLVPLNALDGNTYTRWSTAEPQTKGQWFLVDMGSICSFSKITLDASAYPTDYPHGYQVFASPDGSNWGNAIASGNGSGQLVTISFTPQSARFIKVVQTGNVSNWWSIDEFNVYS